MASYIVDTSIWIDFLRGKSGNLLTQTLQHDLRRGVIGITDIIRHEILVGARNQIDYDNLGRLLSPLECFRIIAEEQTKFDQFAWTLHRKGLKNRYTDLAIAFLCHRHGLPLLANDSYFHHLNRMGVIRTIRF